MCVTAHSTSQPFFFSSQKRLTVVWIIYSVWLWPLSAADNVEEKKHFLCINYLHNGHKKIIIIKNEEALMAAGRMKVAKEAVSLMPRVPEKPPCTLAETEMLQRRCCWHRVVPHLPLWQELPVPSSTQSEESDEHIEGGRCRRPTCVEGRWRWAQHSKTIKTKNNISSSV